MKLNPVYNILYYYLDIPQRYLKRDSWLVIRVRPKLHEHETRTRHLSRIQGRRKTMPQPTAKDVHIDAPLSKLFSAITGMLISVTMPMAHWAMRQSRITAQPSLTPIRMSTVHSVNPF